MRAQSIGGLLEVPVKQLDAPWHWLGRLLFTFPHSLRCRFRSVVHRLEQSRIRSFTNRSGRILVVRAVNRFIVDRNGKRREEIVFWMKESSNKKDALWWEYVHVRLHPKP